MKVRLETGDTWEDDRDTVGKQRGESKGHSRWRGWHFVFGSYGAVSCANWGSCLAPPQAVREGKTGQILNLGGAVGYWPSA